MNYDKFFKGQYYGCPVYKHGIFPIYDASQFVFYRCVEFDDSFYGKTASKLFNDNLRYTTGRFSNIFPSQKLSYWASSPETARAEIKKHGAEKNILTFCAYDDASSTFPTLPQEEPLVIIDGRKSGVGELIDKVDSGENLDKVEYALLSALLNENPDCLVYDSHAIKSTKDTDKDFENYIFFEKGFRKLSLRSLKLRFGREDGGSYNQIICAKSADYIPIIENYGQCFKPKAKKQMDKSYLKTDEYFSRKQIFNEAFNKMKEALT